MKLSSYNFSHPLPPVPGRPTMMISTTIGNTALIQWQPPKDMVGEMMGYQLQYRRQEDTAYTSREFKRTDDHYTATGLHKGATYVFRLSARNRAGIGEAYVKEISTQEDVPSGFPLNLRVTGCVPACVCVCLRACVCVCVCLP
uniref:Fibronectin type-III domain-containing protein n=1 Tax=Hucho hucho TaxID=62062 RepID=A0A4W5PNF2_9TELE